MVMMSLLREEALRMSENCYGSKGKELHGLAVGDLLVGKTLYRSPAAASFDGDQIILNLLKNLTLS